MSDPGKSRARTDLDVPQLRAAWVRTIGAREDGETTFAELLAAYSEPVRAYHNVQHLGEVLEAIDLLAAQARDLTAVRLAAWFHDAVYDPRASDNEERSAVWAGKALASLGVPEAQVNAVRRLILLTKAHCPEPDDVDGCVLLDSDLAILGAEESRYRAYAEAIRCEYAWVPDDGYRAGRAKVLRGFLARERIYNTSVMRARLEDRARRNLESELRALEADAD